MYLVENVFHVIKTRIYVILYICNAHKTVHEFLSKRFYQ